MTLAELKATAPSPERTPKLSAKVSVPMPEIQVTLTEPVPKATTTAVESDVGDDVISTFSHVYDDCMNNLSEADADPSYNHDKRFFSVIIPSALADHACMVSFFEQTDAAEVRYQRGRRCSSEPLELLMPIGHPTLFPLDTSLLPLSPT